tara:strand:- start:289 stop:1416 length:1128 start_codon:yes stop_codon:yes gene_type:complete
MPINEQTLESFLGGNMSILDEIIGTEASQLTNILNSATISGMQTSEILNQVSTASSASASRSLINTRLNTYSRVATNTMMKDAPDDTKYVYIGPVDERTRDECLDMAFAGALTEEQIINQFGNAPLVDGGGFNCRHKWEIASEEGIKLFEGKKAKQVIKDKTTITKTATTAAKPKNSFSSMPQATEYIKNTSYKELMPDELNIINAYTNTRHNELNFKLRTYNSLVREKQKFPNMNIGTLPQDIIRDKNLLNKALNKLPSYKGDVYRGLTFEKYIHYNDFIKSIKVGQTTSRPQFTSTSASELIAQSFALESEFSAMLKIKSKDGKWLNGLSEIEHELEVLFKTDSLFEIKKIETITVFDNGVPKDIIQITMKEI